MSVVEQELLTGSGSQSLMRQVPATAGISDIMTSSKSPAFGPERREISFEVSKSLAGQPWLRPILRRLLGFLDLGENWNGYGERPIHESALKRVVAVLDVVCPEGPVPDVVPTSDGGVQIEWSIGGHEIEIEVLPIGSAQIYLAEPSGSEREMAADASSTMVWGLLRNHVAQLRSATD